LKKPQREKKKKMDKTMLFVFIPFIGLIPVFIGDFFDAEEGSFFEIFTNSTLGFTFFGKDILFNMTQKAGEKKP